LQNAYRQSAYRYAILTSGWYETLHFTSRMLEGYTALLRVSVPDQSRREVRKKFTGEGGRQHDHAW